MASMLKGISRRLCLLVLTGYASASVALAGQGLPDDFDDLVRRSMDAFDVPGMAVAIVKDGQVVLSKGYGVRKVEYPDKVDDATLFAIASNTKAFTAAAIAMLVDEGKVGWDDPVVRHIPEFRMSDPFITRELTIRDLLSHRSGLGEGAGDLMYMLDAKFTREQVVQRVGLLPVASSFRDQYNYSNIGYVVLGHLIERVTGASWDSFIKERILEPAGMTATYLNGEISTQVTNLALPHTKGWYRDKPLASFPSTRDIAWAPAAGLRSTASDVSKWIALLLSGGKLPNGRQLVSAKSLHEMWSIQTPLKTLRTGLALNRRSCILEVGLNTKEMLL